MNKEEAIQFLKQKKTEIDQHDWSLHPEDYKKLDHIQMKSWLDLFDIPVAKFEHGYCFGLPKNWLAESEEESEDYNDVVEAYEAVYFYLRELASAEEDVQNEIDRKDDVSKNRNYIHSLI